jgi:hypothetical protein
MRELTEVRCWRSECSRGCYYPETCTEKAPEGPATVTRLHPCRSCGVELDADDTRDLCEDCEGPEMCGATHQAIDNGAPCRYLAGHLDADIPHTTANGFWWHDEPQPAAPTEPEPHVEIIAHITNRQGEVETVYVGSQPVWAWETPGALTPWRKMMRALLLGERTSDPRGWRVTYEAGYPV